MCRMPAGRSTLEWLTGRRRTFAHRRTASPRCLCKSPRYSAPTPLRCILPDRGWDRAADHRPPCLLQDARTTRRRHAGRLCLLPMPPHRSGWQARHSPRSPRASESGASCASGHDAPCREQTPCAVVHCEIGQPPIMKAQTHVRAGRQGGTAGHTAVTPLPPSCRADVTDSAGAKAFRVRVRGRDAPASARLERGKYRDKARPEGLRRARPEGEGRAKLFQNCLKSHR